MTVGERSLPMKQRDRSKGKKLTASQKLSNLADAIVEDIMSLSDEEVLAEICDDGENPKEVVQDMRCLVDEAIQKAKKKALDEHDARINAKEIQRLRKARLP